jgi:gas vesicle protein
VNVPGIWGLYFPRTQSTCYAGTHHASARFFALSGISKFKKTVMTTNTKIILGIVGAAAAGAVIGLLLAPEKGSELRERIKAKAGDFAGEIADLVATGKEKLGVMKDSAVEEANNLKSEAENRVNKLKQGLS